MSSYRSVTDYGVLEANTECGEGHIRMHEHFYDQSAIWRLDVVQDWVNQLEELHDQLMALEEHEEDLRAMREKAQLIAFDLPEMQPQIPTEEN